MFIIFFRSSSLPLVASTWPSLWMTIPEIFQLTFSGLHMAQPVDDYSWDFSAYLWRLPLGLACGWHRPVHSSDRWSHPPAAGPSSPDRAPADTALHGPGSTAHLLHHKGIKEITMASSRYHRNFSVVNFVTEQHLYTQLKLHTYQ